MDVFIKAESGELIRPGSFELHTKFNQKQYKAYVKLKYDGGHQVLFVANEKDEPGIKPIGLADRVKEFIEDKIKGATRQGKSSLFIDLEARTNFDRGY